MTNTDTASSIDTSILSFPYFAQELEQAFFCGSRSLSDFRRDSVDTRGFVFLHIIHRMFKLCSCDFVFCVHACWQCFKICPSLFQISNFNFFSLRSQPTHYWLVLPEFLVTVLVSSLSARMRSISLHCSLFWLLCRRLSSLLSRLLFRFLQSSVTPSADRRSWLSAFLIFPFHVFLLSLVDLPLLYSILFESVFIQLLGFLGYWSSILEFVFLFGHNLFDCFTDIFR